MENRWEDGGSRQHVIATLGRLDQLLDSGQLDAVLLSGARLSRTLLLLSEHTNGRLPVITTRSLGPGLIFDRLWRENRPESVRTSVCQGPDRGRVVRRRRELFTGLDVVFFDTTSIYFEGEGGDELGQRGYSKDHRPTCTRWW